MARHGENIRKRKDGRWEGRHLMYSEKKGRQIYHSVYGSTYEEVKEKLATQKNIPQSHYEQASCGNSGFLHSEQILFQNVAEAWLSQVKVKQKKSTYAKYYAVYSNYIKQTFWDIPLSDISRQFVSKQTFGPISDSMQKSIYCVLNQILKFACIQYSIVVPHMERPATEARKKPVEVLTKSEQTKLLTFISHKHNIFELAVLLCMYTGLRLGEICALKWVDIDFDNKIIFVGRTVQRLNTNEHKTKTILYESDPKSVYSKREIPLSETTLHLLDKLRNNDEYIFGGSKPMEPRTLQYNFKRILKEAGIPDKNFHILRHTFATNCIEGGTDAKSLSELLGHADVQITLNRYVHPSMDIKRKHMDDLCLFYGQIGSSIEQQCIYNIL